MSKLLGIISYNIIKSANEDCLLTWNKWACVIEETANKFDNLLGYEPFQEDVNNAFDSLKKIFLGLWLI